MIEGTYSLHVLVNEKDDQKIRYQSFDRHHPDESEYYRPLAPMDCLIVCWMCIIGNKQICKVEAGILAGGGKIPR